MCQLIRISSWGHFLFLILIIFFIAFGSRINSSLSGNVILSFHIVILDHFFINTNCSSSQSIRISSLDFFVIKN